MAEIDRAAIEQLARLARIEVSTAEAQTLQQEFNEILGYVGQINSRQTDGASALHEATSEPRAVAALRDDEITHDSGEHTEALLDEAPERDGYYVKVRKVL